MAPLSEKLKKQLESEYKEEAENCIKIYNALRNINDGHVWSSQWNVLTTICGYIGRWPNASIAYKPSSLGEIFLKGIPKH